MQFGSDLVIVIDAIDSLVRSSPKLTQQQISHFSEVQMFKGNFNINIPFSI